MTGTELRSIAKRNGIVKWLNSGKIEQLRMADTGAILASSLLPGSKEHFLWNVRNQYRYFCVEINASQPIRLGDLLT